MALRYSAVAITKLAKTQNLIKHASLSKAETVHEVLWFNERIDEMPIPASKIKNLPSSKIEVTIRSTTGAEATFGAPPNTSLLGLLKAGGKQIDEDLERDVESGEYCLSLVLPNLQISLDDIKMHNRMVLQVSLINKIPEIDQLEVLNVIKPQAQTEEV